MSMRYSVILPTYNRPDVLAETLRRLLDVDYPSGAFELLVADNSNDETPHVVERIAATARTPVRLLRSDERLPAVKRNCAVREAIGDYVVLMNDDVWVEPSFLREHDRSHAAHPGEPVAVLGHVRQSAAMPWTSFTEWYRPFAYAEIEHRDGQSVGARYFWSINISLPRREMLDRNLLFHEDWAEIGHEDVELGHRWVAAGRRIIYNARARGDHYHPHTLDSACRLQHSIGRGLRDLEVLVDDTRLLERYGVFSWRNSPRAVARGVARRALFNQATVPPLQRWLARQTKNTPVSRWLYWKVLLHHTNAGYRSARPRQPERLVTLPTAGVTS